MKKLSISFLMVSSFLVSLSAMATGEKYRINDASVEAVFNESKMISGTVFSNEAGTTMALGTLSTASYKQNPAIALVLNFFLGAIAIHRVYLGGTPVLVLGYLVTFFGIFGLVPLVDLIVTAVNYGDISKYVDSNKFFMW